MSDEKADPVKQAQGFLAKIVEDPKSYLLLALGVIIGAGGTAGAGWGFFGEKTQSAVLDVLDASGRQKLQQELKDETEKRKEAGNHAGELEKQLKVQTDRADEAERNLAITGPLPVEVTARPITSDKSKVVIKVSFHSRSPKEFEFGFVSKPQLVV